MRLVIACLVIFITTPSLAAELHVSTAQEFQAALTTTTNNGASDTIYLGAGTYTGGFSHLSLENESLTISSEPGLTNGNVVLDGGGMYRVLNLVNVDYQTTFTITNLTIANGQDPLGGGLNVATPDGDIFISDCVFHSNDGGEGLAVNAEVPLSAVQGSIYFQRNTVIDNGSGTALYRDRSAAVYLEIFSSGTILVEDNIISGNNLAGGSNGAGALYARGVSTSKIEVQRNTVANNIGPSWDSIINLWDGSITLTDNTVQGNSSTNGGAIEVRGRSSTISDNIIYNNSTATGHVAGLYLDPIGSGVFISNNLILNNENLSTNESWPQTGGLYVRLGSTDQPVFLINNTITGNSAYAAGGVRADIAQEARFYMYNNIVWGNGDLAQSSVDIILEGLGVKTGFNNDYSTLLGLWGSYADNIDADPVFVGVDDYQLQTGSPCINAGQNLVPDLPLTDYGGHQPRIMDGVVDIGAYEYPGAILPVAVFSVDSVQGAIPLTVDFSDESIGTVTTWAWDFGDGAFSSEQNPSHTYNEEGSYTVSLTVTGPNGSTVETKNDLIKVDLAPPVAEAGPDRAIAQNKVFLDGSSSSDVDGSIVSYGWTLTHHDEPAYNQTAAGVNPEISDLAPGLYDVELKVTDDDGLTGIDTSLLSIAEQWDVNNDQVLGLEEVIHILRIITGND